MPKSAMLTLRLTPELKAKLRELAQAQNRSLANLIVTILDSHINKRGK